MNLGAILLQPVALK